MKELALAMGELGHRVDIITRRIADADWPQFAAPCDGYPDRPEANVRILRIPCGPDRFLPKEELWPHLGPDWTPGILDFYRNEGVLPHALPLTMPTAAWWRPSSGEKRAYPCSPGRLGRALF